VRGENAGNAEGIRLTARFGPFTVDRQRRRLSRDSVDVHLTPKAFDLLVLLVDEAPRVVPKGELHERLWPDTYVSDATLVGLIKELRRALDDRDSAAPIIRTVNRVGYGLAQEAERPVRRQSTWHWLAGRDQRFPLRAGGNMIGRDLDSVVFLDVASVSRHHATIAIGDGQATLEDLDSKNGTRVNGSSVTAPVVLQDGDRITVGKVSLTYRRSTSGLSTETHASSIHPSSSSPSRGARGVESPPTSRDD
jgi:DNA-binding winged helix-turn-helix (wHTH) protein